jgi:pyruvate/2-oxoglutarate dehydrogenase complex dihydrolipoamide acyltransferase (E2) component
VFKLSDDDVIGVFEEVPFPRERVMVIDMFRVGLAKHTISGLMELDVTEAREFIRNHKARTGERLSFTGWVIRCIAQAVNEHKQVQAFRKGKKKMVVFEDVDVLLAVERVLEGDRVALPYVVRKANEKSARQIHEEIRAAQTMDTDVGVIGSERDSRLVRWVVKLPSVLRRLLWRKYKDPFFVKRISGTVGITAIGMFGSGGGWPLTIRMHPLDFALGGITEKPGVVKGRIKVREFLSVTVMLDHDVVDGAPAARFIARLRELVENGFALNEF